MKSAALLFLLSFLVAAASGEIVLKNHFSQQQILHTHNTYRAWNRYKIRYNKHYGNLEEDNRRFLIFANNKKHIERHNRRYAAGSETYEMELNHLSDKHPYEYQHLWNGFLSSYRNSKAKGLGATFMAPHHVQAPREKDWRPLGYVTKVKNQGRCGSCWSFSATGSLEGQHRRKTGRLVSLSEQNLVDCSGPEGNHGCNGGLMDQAFQYVKINGGIDTETSYPYKAREGRCRFRNGTVGAHDTGFVDIPSGDEHQLKIAVATVGPISVAIDAAQPSFHNYKAGVYYDPGCDPEALDHGVLVVGYGVDPEGGDYWLVKNSWGEHWGDEGYIKMARNRGNMCGIATKASYPLV